MTNATIAPTDLAEKRADAPFIKQTLQFALQRLMEMESAYMLGALKKPRSRQDVCFACCGVSSRRRFGEAFCRPPAAPNPSRASPDKAAKRRAGVRPCRQWLPRLAGKRLLPSSRQRGTYPRWAGVPVGQLRVLVDVIFLANEALLATSIALLR